MITKASRPLLKCGLCKCFTHILNYGRCLSCRPVCSPLAENSNAAGVALGTVGQLGGCTRLATDGQGVCTSLATIYARNVVSCRRIASSQPRGFYKRYWQAAARVSEQMLGAYANALLSGHVDSRIVRRFEAV